MEIKNLFFFGNNHKQFRKKKLISIINNPYKIPSNNFMNYGYDYFDNNLVNSGYAKYVYDGRFKKPAHKIEKYFNLKKRMKICEFGCAKGYLLFEFLKKNYKIIGFEKSKYAIKKSFPKVSKKIKYVKNIESLKKYKFDFFICKNVLPHLTKKEIHKLIKVSITNGDLKPFFVIPTYKKNNLKKYYKFWDRTHKTIMNIFEWRKFLKKYDGNIFYTFDMLF